MIAPDWIQTFTGRKFWPLEPREADVDIRDIAHALANMCRFAGHTKEFYSVGQHSLAVASIVPPHLAIYGLLHDASEAYLVDIPTPIKQHSGFWFYRNAEERLQSTILRRFGLPQLDPDEEVIIKNADLRMLATEARDLLSPLHPEWKLAADPLPSKIEILEPEHVERLFTWSFHYLLQLRKHVR